ncbi:MAG TPA: RHS repeat-associated core domain-containing protein [Myxococcota bacterium]|nr:RHS repeat-associated core domain-containing protein [Myxococcota bacterium]
MLSAETHLGNHETSGEKSSDRSLYNHFRTYDPVTGRYLESDPLAISAPNITHSYNYEYGLSNPIDNVDVDGAKLRFAPGSSPDFQQQFKDAISYLNDGKVSKTIKELEDDPATVYIKELKDGQDGYLNHVIYWDARSALCTTTGGRQTPALGFLHEAAHALGDLQGTAASTQDNGTPYQNAEEQRVIDNIETPAAIKLGEDTRTDHGDHAYPVPCSVCR